VCKTEQKVEADFLRKVGFPEHDIPTAKFWHGVGCEDCRQFGYQGRKGIYELLLVKENLRPLIMNRAPASTISAEALRNGMRTLRVDGWKKVMDGITTIEEVLRVTQIEEHLDALADGDNTTILTKR
jgi:type II secretory ATPase GspE/PulE/Tfp pilus assembly ATPase PilB-like protein